MLTDLIDTILGPLDLIDRLAATLQLAARRDRGVTFRVLRPDKGGTHNAAAVRAMLARYGIKAHRTRFDAVYCYFVVGARQADWAQYLLTAAGVATTAGQPAPTAAGMPTPWSDQPSSPRRTVKRK